MEYTDLLTQPARELTMTEEADAIYFFSDEEVEIGDNRIRKGDIVLQPVGDNLYRIVRPMRVEFYYSLGEALLNM